MNKLTISPVALTFLAKTPSYKRVTLSAALLLAAVLVPSASAQFIYVANAGENTVSKIDINSNTEVARYATWFTPPTVTPPNPGLNYIATQAGNAWAGPAPSRIAQDKAGNVYVLDRFFSSGTGATGHTWPNNPPHNPVLLKIAPSGVTPTSTGPTALAITDSDNSNDIDIPSEATDTAILWAKPIGQAADNVGVGRAVAVDTTGKVWVGMYSTKQYYKVDPNNGSTIAGPVSTGAHTPYGCAVDVNGKLWSIDEKTGLAAFDTTIATPPVTPYDHTGYGTNYSLAISNDCTSSPPKVKVYISSRDDDTGNTGKTYIVYDSQTGKFSNPPPALASSCPTCLFASVAIAVDSHGDIVSGQWMGAHGGRVIKTSPSGTRLWDTDGIGATVTTADLRGIIIDAHDDVWAVHRVGNRVVKYSGVNGTKLAVVNIGDSPYSYGNVPPPTCTGAPTPTSTPTPTPNPTPIPSGCAQVRDKDVRCDPNGGYNYTFTATNNTGGDMSQILLTPLPGSAFTLSKELFSLPSPLHNGQSITLTVNIGNAKLGDNVCFFVSLMADKTACCTVKVCPTLPKCADTTYPTTPPRPPRPPQPVKRRR